MNNNFVALSFVFLFGSYVSFAQGDEPPQYNPNSVLNIPRYEQFKKVRCWRYIDLREKQNKGFFAKGGQITKLILNAVKSGELPDIYINDSLTVKKSKEDFYSSLQAFAGATFDVWDPTREFYSGDKVTYKGKNFEALIDNLGKQPDASANEWSATQEGIAVYYTPDQIVTLNLMEDWIFDKRRSRLYYDMQGIELSVFSEEKGFNVSLGWFKYKDLEKLFRSHPTEATWFNRQNTAENRNYADAFLLRLFHGTLYKVENPDGDSIFDLFHTRFEGVVDSEWQDVRLMEMEHNLWSY